VQAWLKGSMRANFTMESSSSPPLQHQERIDGTDDQQKKVCKLVLSTHAMNLVRNPIRAVMNRVVQTPGCLSLAGGKPPEDAFPPLVRQRYDQKFMNYGPHLGAGHEDLKNWAREFVDRFHSPPGGWEQRDVVITSGNTDGMTKVVMLLSEPGDVILADELTYPGITSSAVPMGRVVLGVGMDSCGMIPSKLESTIENFAGPGKLKLLYLCPHGQNPTGLTMTKERKVEIYKVARRHDLVIMEDDPYLFINLSPKDSKAPLEPENMVGSDQVPESFLSMDTDGRVIRLDTASKFLAPGFRLGWATGSKDLMAKWTVLSETTTWSVSGVLQDAFLSVMRDMGNDGLHRHLQEMQFIYAQRCGFATAACQRHLDGLCRWGAVDFGMFLWLEVLDTEDTGDLVFALIDSHGVAMVPGGCFNASGKSCKSSFFRLSFSLLSEDVADQAFTRVKAALTQQQM